MQDFLLQLINQTPVKRWFKKTFGVTLGAAIIFLTIQILSYQTTVPGTKNSGNEVAVPTEGLYKTGRVVSVVDGDTVKVKVENVVWTVRLIGIDTPEINHPTQPPGCYGPEAKAAIEKLILDKEVRMESDKSDKDRYGRYLRYIWLEHTLINEYLVHHGYAYATSYPPDVKYQERLNTAEEFSRTALNGLWSPTTCLGKR